MSARRTRRSRRKVLSLVSFLVRSGGINDVGGDVLAILGTHRARPCLISRKGRTLDQAAMLALEAGYFPEHVVDRDGAMSGAGLAGAMREAGTAAETMTPAILLQAIDAEMRGTKRWPGGEAPAAEVDVDPTREEAETDAARYAVQMMWERLAEQDADWSPIVSAAAMDLADAPF